MKDLTKWEFANTLINLMKYKTIDRITVREICDLCGTSTQSFYYHFRDKYDLITWFYKQDVESVWYSDLDRPGNELMHLCYEHIWEKRDFYRNGFADSSDNSLVKHIVEFEIDLYSEVLRRKNVIIDEAMEFAIEYHSFACTEMTRVWLLSRDPASPGRLTELIMESMPAKLREPLMRPGKVQETQGSGQ